MKISNKVLSALALSIVGSHAHAALEGNGYVTESGIKVIPIFNSAYEYNDNIGRYSKQENPESSSLVVLEPGVALQAERGESLYQLLYQLSSGTYFDSRDDNYIDHRFVSENFISINRRNSLSIDYAFLYQHEERGTGILAGDNLSTIAESPVEFSVHKASITHAYGSDEAKGRIESSLRLEDKNYQNYRNIKEPQFTPLSTKYKDYFEFGIGMAFYYRALPATQLLVEVDVNNRDYKYDGTDTTTSQDSVDRFLLTGATWDITGKTKGKLRLGFQNKSYSEADKVDFNGFSWDLDLEWKPLSYSTVLVSAAQRAKDPEQGSNYVDEKSFDSNWKHYWRSNLFTNLSFLYVKDDYSESTRTEDLYRLGLGLGYELRDDIEIGAGWRLENNDSSIEQNKYKQNVYYVSANLIF
ncbi:outer membrane beta-barrel protein [Vibrio sp. MarTm2]|uniref:outer membrane beta-barrel protein n=1 Tax=Vibrio sp. MarTm2 TaxID=2998831 RepID=UPI0022CD3F3E|nr:outer membrane beta-barrel protein [Vibrio sp. MarTm2]MDA0127942.1 outer membrane beta-barrel protein [Vibrio sp. MarTm2]